MIAVCFYATSGGTEPVREWLLKLTKGDRRAVGQDIKTAQYGWPLGMPLIRKLEPGLWEVRTHIAGGIARVLFTVDGQTAARGPSEGVNMVNEKHLGSDFDDFLREEGLLDEVESVAAKRVIAFEIAREMERAHITQSELARRMKTSRSAVERLLDPANPSVTLSTLERAAHAVGKRLKIQLTA